MNASEALEKLDDLYGRIMASPTPNVAHLAELTKLVGEIMQALLKPRVFVSSADCDMTWNTEKAK